MEHGRRLGRGVDQRILAVAHRDAFRSFVNSMTFNVFVEGMIRAVALFLPTSRVVVPLEDRKTTRQEAPRSIAGPLVIVP
jgi:hypothetical protein